MSHPDIAWTPYYTAPRGVENDWCCHTTWNRMRVGPTSRRRAFMILVDSCGWCGRILRSHQDLTWREYDWVRRVNAAKERYRE